MVLTLDNPLVAFVSRYCDGHVYFYVFLFVQIRNFTFFKKYSLMLLQSLGIACVTSLSNHMK